MEIKAELNGKFYVMTAIFCAFTGFMTWTYITMLTGGFTIQGKNGEPISKTQNTIFIILLSVVVLTWVVSCIILIRQGIKGYAFIITNEGIVSTLTLNRVLAMLIVVPVKVIPFSAISELECSDRFLNAVIDKTQVDVLPILRLFIPKKYTFFAGYIKEDFEVIKNYVERYTGG